MIAVLSDIHANLAALEAVLDDEGSWDRFVFLGDAVLAGPQPDEVLSLLREVADVCLTGNHDREVLSLDMDEPVSGASRSWRRWHRESISPENLPRQNPALGLGIQVWGSRRQLGRLDPLLKR